MKRRGAIFRLVAFNSFREGNRKTVEPAPCKEGGKGLVILGRLGETRPSVRRCAKPLVTLERPPARKYEGGDIRKAARETWKDRRARGNKKSLRSVVKMRKKRGERPTAKDIAPRTETRGTRKGKCPAKALTSPLSRKQKRDLSKRVREGVSGTLVPELQWGEGAISFPGERRRRGKRDKNSGVILGQGGKTGEKAKRSRSSKKNICTEKRVSRNWRGAGRLGDESQD